MSRKHKRKQQVIHLYDPPEEVEYLLDRARAYQKAKTKVRDNIKNNRPVVTGAGDYIGGKKFEDWARSHQRLVDWLDRAQTYLFEAIEELCEIEQNVNKKAATR